MRILSPAKKGVCEYQIPLTNPELTSVTADDFVGKIKRKKKKNTDKMYLYFLKKKRPFIYCKIPYF